MEVAGRIALPLICFAGRRLAVLATPPRKLERKTGVAPVLPDWRSGVLLLYDFRFYLRALERAVRVELTSSGWKPEAPAAIPCPPVFNLRAPQRFAAASSSPHQA